MAGDNHLQEAGVSQCEEKERMLKKTGGKGDRIARSNRFKERNHTEPGSWDNILSFLLNFG